MASGKLQTLCYKEEIEAAEQEGIIYHFLSNPVRVLGPAKVTAIEVLVWPVAMPIVLILVNFAIAAVLIVIFSKSFKLGWGRVEV
jgi:hypothetical protein